MIDLRNDALPLTIEAGGRAFSIDTNFRTWIKFYDFLNQGVFWWGFLRDQLPSDSEMVAELALAAEEFLAAKSATPKSKGEEAERVIDYVLDGDYIVASFQAVYGIDLTTGEMHWWRFQALLRGLPKDCKMAEIMGYRSYVRSSGKSYDASMRELRDMWRLPDPQKEIEDQAINDWFDSWCDENGLRR